MALRSTISYLTFPLLLALGCTDFKETKQKEEKYVEPSRPISSSSKDPYEDDDSQIKAKPLAVNSTQEHNFYDDYADWYSFEVEKDKTYIIETFVSQWCDTELTLYKGSTKLQSNNDKNKSDAGSKIEYLATEPGILHIKATSYMYRTGTNRPYTISLTENGNIGQQPLAKKDWTLMVYLDGDNNLDLSSTFDISEMCSAIQLPEDSKTFNVVVLWDNRATKHGYYEIESGKEVLKLDIGEPNMGNPQTAKNFIDWSTKYYPAEHNMIIFWNHGGGMDRGVCWDDTNNEDHLSEVEQLNILEYGKSLLGKKWDVVGYDACLMACGELHYQLRNVADYMVASQENEPGGGWDYRFLNLLRTTPGITAEQVARGAATYYAQYYGKRTTETISVADLSKADSFATALDQFCKEAMLHNDGYLYKSIASSLPLFGETVSKDLTLFMNKIISNPSIQPSVKIKAQEVNQAVKNLLIYEWHGASWNDKAFGVSMTMKADTQIYSLLDLCKNTQWDEFCSFAKF